MSVHEVAESGWRRYQALLAVRSAPRVLLASFAAGLSSSARTLALVLLVQASTQSFALAGGAAAASALGAAALAPVRGRLVDRFGQGQVLVPMTLFHVAAWVGFVLLPANVSREVLFGLAVVGGASFPPVYACVRTAWSHAFQGDSRLSAAYSLNAAVLNVATVAGPVVAAAIVGISSAAVALIASVLLTVASVVLLTTSSLSRSVVSGQRGVVGAVLRSAGLRSVMAVMLLFGMVLGSIDVVVPAAAIQVGLRGYAGVLLGAFAVGDLLGALVYGARDWPIRRATQVAASFAIGAVVALVISVPSQLLIIGSLLVLMGAVMAPILINAFHLLDAIATKSQATEAFTWLASAQLAGISIGAAVAGRLVQGGGSDLAFVADGVVLGVAAVVSSVALRAPSDAELRSLRTDRSNL